MNKLSITNAFCTASRIDTNYPKLAKFGFSFAAVRICVSFTTINSVFSIPKETRLIAEISSSFL
jgi:hypothetical protein